MRKSFPFYLVFVLILALSTFSIGLALDERPGDIEPTGGTLIQAPAARWPGPDGFGYLGSTPTFVWIEISTVSKAIFLGDDDFAGPYDIGFPFNFYGTGWTEFYISSNGFLSFGEGSAVPTNECSLPKATVPNNIIALMWDDLDPEVTNDPIYYKSYSSSTCPYPDYRGACLVVEYGDFCHAPGGAACAKAGTFEAILFDNGSILIQIGDSGDENGSGSTTGIENNLASFDYGLTYACNFPASLRDMMAIQFTPQPQLSLLPAVVNSIGCPSQPQELTFTLINNTLADGTFDLTYSSAPETANLSGPDSILLPRYAMTDFAVTLTPSCALPGTVIESQVAVAGNELSDSAAIHANIFKALADWEQLAPINGPARSLLAGAAVEGKVYIFGGETSGGVANSVEMFDPASGIWITQDENLMPTAASDICAGAIGSDVYLAGGYNAAAGYLDTLQVYHTTTDTWSIITTDPLPVPLASTGCAVYDGKLYVYGGVTTGDVYLASAYVYDPSAAAENRWSSLPGMAYARGYLAGVTVDDKIYAVGGRNLDTSDLAYVEVYNPAENQWHTVTPLNDPRGGPGAYAWDNKLVACGGGWIFPLFTCEMYDTAQGVSGAWVNIGGTLNIPRRSFAYASLPEGMYAVAGYNYDPLASAERLTLFDCPLCTTFLPLALKTSHGR